MAEVEIRKCIPKSIIEDAVRKGYTKARVIDKMLCECLRFEFWGIGGFVWVLVHKSQK